MKMTFRLLTAIGLAIAIAAFLTPQADARRHLGARSTPQQMVVKSDGKPIVEQKRDPADIALDRRIKGICRGC